MEVAPVHTSPAMPNASKNSPHAVQPESVRNASEYLVDAFSNSAISPFNSDPNFQPLNKPTHDPALNIVAVSPLQVKQSPVPTKSRKAMREQRAARVAAEQANWVRETFHFHHTEQLIASFSAAMVRHILLQGRIYITSSSVCFHAKIFGKVTKETYPFSSIARIKKRRGGFVANAIKIYFLNQSNQPVIIGSLNHRERTFNLVQARLREVNPTAAEPADGDDYGSQQSVANSVVADLNDNFFENDVASNLHLGSQKSQNAPHAQRVASNALSAPSHLFNTAAIQSDSSESSSQKSTDHSLVQRTSPPESPLVWRTEHDQIDRIVGKLFDKRLERARCVISAPVKDVFNLIFVGEWLGKYHEAIMNREVTFTPWDRDTEGIMRREVNFRAPLAYKIGPKETRVNEKQTYTFRQDGGVLFEVEGHNLDILYGGYFVLESFFELVPQGDSSKTLLIASVAINFMKNTMLKSKIESGALAGTTEAYQKLCELAPQRVAELYRPRIKVQSSSGTKRTVRENPVLRSMRSVRKASQSDVPVSQMKEVVLCKSTALNSSGKVAEEVRTDVKSNTGIDGSQQSSPAVRVEVRDSEATKWIRIATLVVLAFVCLLLLLVILLLFRMRRDVVVFERLIAEAGVRSKCVVVDNGNSV